MKYFMYFSKIYNKTEKLKGKSQLEGSVEISIDKIALSFPLPNL